MSGRGKSWRFRRRREYSEIGRPCGSRSTDVATMSTQLSKPTRAQRLDIRCNVADVLAANAAVHIIFFFNRHLNADALRRALARALTNMPLFAGRMTMRHGGMRIRCNGQGVPFTCASSDCTLDDAIRSLAQDRGDWLIDPVNGAAARWGFGPLCKIRITHLAEGATAIGVSWHHVVGDMQTLMIFMRAWAAAAAGQPIAEPLIVEDRASYLDEQLPACGAPEPTVRCLGFGELGRSVLYLATDARKQRTASFYFGDDELARMRDTYGSRMRLSANDIVCAHISEALMSADPATETCTLAIAVNIRNRCGLDPMLVGNMVTAVKFDLRRGEGVRSTAERIRQTVDHFADEHCDLRVNQRFLDAAGGWRGARCMADGFDPARWNPVITNWSGFGVYRLRFEDTYTSYCTPLMKFPIAGVGILVEGVGGRGLVFQMTLPPEDFEAMCSPAIREHMHRFRRADDDIPRLHREVHG